MRHRHFAVFIALMSMVAAAVAKDDAPIEDFIKHHLASIATDQVRAGIKNRVVQGNVTYQVLNRGPQTWEGPATMVTEGNRLATLMKFPPTVYITEWFVRDERKTSIAPVRPGHWTEFGNFVKAHDEILTEGLWGGTLSTGWALSHLEENRARLQDRGVKKVDGVELHRIDYTPKRGSDLEIQLYFEPDTFRHVMTVYLMTITAHSGRTVNDSINEKETHYRLEERFGEFTTTDNVTLPTRWTVRFSFGEIAAGVVDQFDVTERKMSQNISVDAKNFEIK